MKIACLQFTPHLGDVNNNLNRADSVLSKANAEELDLLVLPELAFSGYRFESQRDIARLCEPSQSGITSLWARSTALKYNCHVAAGYPEKVPTSREHKCFNSTILVNREGETVTNYRKVFLHDADKVWAQEGEGFYSGSMPEMGKVCLGICTDINPRDDDTPRHAFEFAHHVLDTGSTLVIVTMSWITLEEPRSFSRMPNEPDMESLMQWVTRLEPLIRSESMQEVFVVFCNRCGSENGTTYAGTSTVLGIVDGEVKVYGLLGRGDRELLIVDTDMPPFGKLVYRPDWEEEHERTADAGKSSFDDEYSPNASPTASQAQPTRLHQSIDATIGPSTATRPKLVIPETDVQSTLGSARSETSAQSTKSDARPPEDSTPYPHSAGTRSLEAYLAGKRVYGGDQVIVSHFEEQSPAVSPQTAPPSAGSRPWRPPETLVWTPEAMGAEYNAPPEKEARRPHSQIAPEVDRAGYGAVSSEHQHKDNVPNRPSSPKSRNASRGGGERQRLSLVGPSIGDENGGFERVEAVLSPNCPVHGQQGHDDASADTEQSLASTEVTSAPSDEPA